MNTTTRKYSNPYHNTSGSVSSKAHINKKKFRNILAGQRIGKDGYNNCINGQLCSMYMVPGPNTKLISLEVFNNRCLPPRIRGRKQRCPYLTNQEYSSNSCQNKINVSRNKKVLILNLKDIIILLDNILVI